MRIGLGCRLLLWRIRWVLGIKGSVFRLCGNRFSSSFGRETIYGKKKKNSDEDDFEHPVINAVDEDDVNPETGSPRAKHDPYKLSLPDFPMKLTAKQMEEEELNR